MIVGEDGHVGGSINREQLAGLLAGTDDEDLKAEYRALLGESDEGDAYDASQADSEESEEDPETAQSDAEAELDALRSQADDAGVKVDKRWGADRLKTEIAAAQNAEATRTEGGDE